MTIDELLDDLDERCAAAEQQLLEMSQRTADVIDRARLIGKYGGVALVRDWLRSY